MEFGMETKALTHFLLLILIASPARQECLPRMDLENLGFKGALTDEIEKKIICGELHSCVPFEVLELKAWFDSQKLHDKTRILNSLLLKLDQFWKTYESQDTNLFDSRQSMDCKLIR